MKESNIISAWEKSGLRSLDPGSFGADNYGLSQLTSTNAFLPPSYPQVVPADIDLDSGSDTVSDSSGDTPWTSYGSDDEHSNDPTQPTAGPSHSHGDPSQSLIPHSTSHSTHFSTPPPSLKSDRPDHLSQRQSGSAPRSVPLALTPRRICSHGLFTPLPSGLPKKDCCFTD